MSRTCWSIWWLQQHRDGSTLAFLFVSVFGRWPRAFIREFLGLYWPHTPFTWSPHIYFNVLHVFSLTDDVSLSLIPFVHVVDRGDGIWRRAPTLSVLTPSLRHGGRLRRMWGLHVSFGHGWGVGAHLGPPVQSSMTVNGGEAGSDPRGHLWVTWGVYLRAGKPPLADIIPSHPP